MTQRASCSSRRSGRFSFVFCCANSVTCIRLFPFFFLVALNGFWYGMTVVLFNCFYHS